MEMIDGLITVIVPIYNVERYIKRCVESIQNQTYRNLQIILVDDGSTDSTGTICEKMAEEDERVIVLHKENGGPSDAKNYGLLYAKGEFIAFVDSDDYIHPSTYEHMLHVIKEDSVDMVMCEFQEVRDNGSAYADITFEDLCNEKPIIVEGEEILQQLKVRDVQTVVQINKLYKKRIFDNIRFPKGRLHEEVYVIHREMWECEKIAYLSNKYYYYTQRDNSIMHSITERNLRDTIAGFEERISFYEERGCEIGANLAVEQLLLYILWKYDSASKEQKDMKRFLGEELKKHFVKHKDRGADINKYKLPASNLFLYEISRKINKLRQKLKRIVAS